MNLTIITQKACPYCGALPVSQQQYCIPDRSHPYESVRFACGLKIIHSPTFCSLNPIPYYEQYWCKNSPAYKERRQNRQDFISRLFKYITRAKIDSSFKDELLKRVPNLDFDFPKVVPKND